MHLTIVIGELQITYKLNDTPVSRKFVEVADKMKGQPVPDWTTWWRPDMNNLNLDEEWEKLKVYCSKCLLTISDRYDAKNLNDIHRDFHANVEPSNLIMVDLAAVNTQIHLVEAIAKAKLNHQIKKSRWTPKFGCYQYNPNMHFTIPLDDSDYQYFKEAAYNKLMMGYNTVGKNIGHCAFDNDIDTVKQGMVRPQLHASCEIIANLNKPSSVEEEFNPYHDSIRFTDNWVKKNNLGDYIDMTKPCNRVGSRMAEIGDLITPLTDGELDYIFKRQSIDRIIRH